MAIAAVSIAPVGEGTSVSAYVAAALRVVRAQERVRYRLDPMFTTLEGDLRDILDLVLAMEEAVFAAGARRVGTVLKIDDRRDRTASMEAKVEAVERKLAEHDG
ncbi:MAG: MTH1187 family thiamine-binding protein [Myxococcota bacterium]|nr:MTH1187 family thiamine-binding protein [Myxococcales bacterium]